MKITIGSQVQDLVSKAGKEFKKFNVKKEDGSVINDVVAFSFYSKFPEVVANAVLEGVLKEGAEFQGKKSFSLVDGNLGPKPSSFAGGAKNMEAKAKNIEKAQERKEDGIMISSTARMATETTIALKWEGMTKEEFKVEWQKHREWFVNNWENINAAGLTSAGTKVPDFSEVDDINPDEIPF